MSDCLIKLARASNHLEHLQAAIATWLNGGHYRIWTEEDPHRADYFSIRATAEPMPIEPYATLIGDVLHNMRNSLDHMVYAIASKNPHTFTQYVAEHSEFPIYGDKRSEGATAVETRYVPAFAEKIGGLPPQAQTVIKSLQPYHRGNDFASHPLWKLFELCNIDKHRLLISAFFSSHGLGFRPIDIPGIKFGPMDAKHVFIDGETEIGWYKAVRIVPLIEVDVKNLFKPNLEVVFRYGGAMDREVVLETLTEIQQYILKDVAIPLAPFM